MANANADYNSVQASLADLWKIRRIASQLANMDTVPDAAMSVLRLLLECHPEYQEHKSNPSA